MSLLSPPSPGPFLSSSLSLSDHSTNFLQHSKDYPQHNHGWMYAHKGQSFHALIQVLKLPKDTDPLEFSIGDIIASDSHQSRPNRASHPKIRFWRRSDYDAWLDSALVSRIKRGTAPYLEEEDGNHITNATLKSIRRTCRTAWAELVVKKLAPPTWARLCASGQSLMQSVMEKEFPLFRFDADGWKLTLLCTTDYPNWRKRHLNQDGTWKNPDKTAAKREAMDEDDDDMHPDTKPVVHNVKKSKGKKREHSMDDSNASELTNKRQKVSVTPLPEHHLGSPINISDSSASPLSPDHSPPATPIDTASIVVHSSTHTSNTDLPSPLSNHDCNHDPLEGLGNSPDNQHEPDLPLPILPPSSPPRHGAFLPGIPLDNSNKENVPVVLKNPLANIFGGPSGIPKVIPTPALPPIADPSEGSHVKSGPATTGGVNIKKMRPGSTKNGRNLCALRWLKQTNKNGTTDEFKLYWTTLSTAQHDEYQAEAERLDSTGAWKKASDHAVVNGALY
ncbi:hypothetical protein F4604DRAFT_1986122 [Suillus subluteus]|nr:hypothetical protein F4604DRAFT_1986122 [Suillus subluteus]